MSKILKPNKTACTFQDHCQTYQLHRNPETRTGSPTARDCLQAMTRHTPHRCLLRLLGPSRGNVKSFPTGPQDLVTCVFSSVQLETGKPGCESRQTGRWRTEPAFMAVRTQRMQSGPTDSGTVEGFTLPLCAYQRGIASTGGRYTQRFKYILSL